MDKNKITLSALSSDVAACMERLEPLASKATRPEVVIKTGSRRYSIPSSPSSSKATTLKKDKDEGATPMSEKRGEGGEFECTVCYKGFESEIALKSHMRTHGMAFIRSKRTHE